MRKNWTSYVFVLILGLILGAALGRMTTRHFLYRNDTPQERLERKFKWFSNKLDLTAQQESEIKELFRQKHEKIKALHDEIEPRFNEIRENSRQEVRALLNEDQAEKFDRMEERRQKWREKRRARKHFKKW